MFRCLCCGRQAGKDLSKASLLAGLAADKQNFHTQTCACWQRSFQSKLAGRPGGRQAKFSHANLCLLAKIFPNQARWPAWRQAKFLKRKPAPAGGAGKQNFHCELCLLAGPGASKRRRAQISNCWRAQAPATSKGQDLSKSSSLASKIVMCKPVPASKDLSKSSLLAWRQASKIVIREPVPAGRPGRQ